MFTRVVIPVLVALVPELPGISAIASAAHFADKCCFTVRILVVREVVPVVVVARIRSAKKWSHLC
jgi:hypothetical protein